MISVVVTRQRVEPLIEFVIAVPTPLIFYSTIENTCIQTPFR